MNLETEQLKLRLLEAQMMVLQYQHKEVSANIAQLQKSQNPEFEAIAECIRSGQLTSEEIENHMQSLDFKAWYLQHYQG